MPRKGDGLQKRGNVWWLDCRIDGQRYQEALGKCSKTIAAEKATFIRGEIIRGQYRKKRKDISFEEAQRLFLEWSETNRKPHSVTMHRACLKKLSEKFSGKRLSQIVRFSVENYKKERAKIARIRTNRELQTLKSLYNRMIEFGRYDGPNPVVGVKLLKESRNSRERFLSQEEEDRLLAASREPLRAILTLGIHTGIRIQSEALTLTWGSVDLLYRKLTVLDAHAKNSTSRTVPLNRKAHEALVRHRERSENVGSGDRVFVNRLGKPLRSVRTAFTTARKKAGLGKDVTPHSLRHTFASRLVMAGVDLRTVQELGGWKRIEMVVRYSHLSAEHRVQAVEKIAQAPTVQQSEILKAVL